MAIKPQEPLCLTAGTYNLALLAIQQEDFDEFGFLV